MSNIELVIKIPKEKYDVIQSVLYNTFPAEMKEWGLEAIRNGTPLSKGHGILKDVDNIKTAFPCGEYIRTESVRATIDHEETIIEADKAEREGNNDT